MRFLLVSCAFGCLFAHLLRAEEVPPRVWRSSDGREIRASYLGRAEDGDSLVLLRADTLARVVVPLTALAVEDRELAAMLPRTPAPPAVVEKSAPPAKKERPTPSAELMKLAGNWPRPDPSKINAEFELLDQNHADLLELRRRFEIDFKSILSGDVAQNCRYLRLKIEREVKRLQADANPSAQIVYDPLRYTPRQRTAYINSQRKVLAARVGIQWLENAVTGHIDQIEKEWGRISAAGSGGGQE
jgi:hypothetical protein